jgi:hypothetical protein
MTMERASIWDPWPQAEPGWQESGDWTDLRGDGSVWRHRDGTLRVRGNYPEGTAEQVAESVRLAMQHGS